MIRPRVTIRLNTADREDLTVGVVVLICQFGILIFMLLSR